MFVFMDLLTMLRTVFVNNAIIDVSILYCRHDLVIITTVVVIIDPVFIYYHWYMLHLLLSFLLSLLSSVIVGIITIISIKISDVIFFFTTVNLVVIPDIVLVGFLQNLQTVSSGFCLYLFLFTLLGYTLAITNLCLSIFIFVIVFIFAQS